MSTDHHSGALVLRRLFVRKAMRAPEPPSISREDLRILDASRQKDDPQDEDLSVDGVSEKTDWDRPAWDAIKSAAVRKACLFNDPQSLPQVGQKIERVVYQPGTVDIYFEDGSFVSAQIEPDEPSAGCGCSHKARQKAATPTVDMVAASYRGRFLGALDARKRGAKDLRYWELRIDGPFDLHVLEEVPLNVARALADFPERKVIFRTPKEGWGVVQKYLQGRPFKTKR